MFFEYSFCIVFFLIKIPLTAPYAENVYIDTLTMRGGKNMIAKLNACDEEKNVKLSNNQALNEILKALQQGNVKITTK